MFQKLLKVSAWAAGGLAGLAALVLAVIWFLGEGKLSQKFAAPEVDLVHSKDAEVLAYGARLAAIAGCDGCHQKNMQGEILGELPDGTRLVAPNVPRIASKYTDQELARVLRYGVRPNGKPVLAMPSEAFFSMTDDDLIAILSHVRATRDEGGELPKSWIGPMARFMLATGKLSTAPALIKDMSVRPQYDFNNEIERGAYLATIACAECHGLDFKGTTFGPDFAPPDLIVASAYTPEEFSALMKTGAATGGRELGLMAEVSRGRLSYFTDEEIAAVYAFLRERAMNPNLASAE